MSMRSTFEPMISWATSNARPCFLNSRVYCRPSIASRTRSSGGQSQRPSSRMSIATTLSAPRRSISNAQNPSQVPTSRQRLPASDAGRGTLSVVARVSNQPGVVSPGRRSIVWYQSRASTRSRADAAVAEEGTRDSIPDSARRPGRLTSPPEPGHNAAAMDERGGAPGGAGGGTEVVQAGGRRPARVESLRALAALAVAAAHAWGLAHAYQPATRESYFGRVVFGGGFGVFLFFALSGYLLFWPFARRYFGGGAPIDLGRYAFNRA